MSTSSRATTTSRLRPGVSADSLQGTYHADDQPARSDVGNYDRSVVQEVLKDIAQTQQVDLNAKKRFKGELDRLLAGTAALTAHSQS